MKKSFSIVTKTICVLILTTSTVVAASINKKELEETSQGYKRWWGSELERRFDELPKTGMVEKHRMPWAGHIYPDRAGGCIRVLAKYDRAFHDGRGLAGAFERHDIQIHEVPATRRGGLLGRRTITRRETPQWAGHCNGWTAAAIRHAEPRNNVTRNGVTFSPADIKGLLAELYVFCDIEVLGGGYEGAVNPGSLHVALANWIGKGKHPIGMDNTLGREIWNYPIYAYNSSSAKRGERQREVKVNVGFVPSTDGEYSRAPKQVKFMYFHYLLDLDPEGKIAGGTYYGDSNRIDLLWTPLQPAQGGQEGNKEGNPHVDVKEVLALWRDSVPQEFRAAWYNINPWPEDAIVDPDGEEPATVSEGEPKEAISPETTAGTDVTEGADSPEDESTDEDADVSAMDEQPAQDAAEPNSVTLAAPGQSS